MDNFLIIRNYKSNKDTELDNKDYYNYFSSRNILMNTKGENVTFSKKVGSLSVKCAFNGQEIYHTSKGKHSVDDNCYLILNYGQEYSGFIKSYVKVNSFSVFFENEFAKDILGSLVTPADKLLDDCFSIKIHPVEFIEKSYSHDNLISPYLFKIKRELECGNHDPLFIEEYFHVLLEKLYLVHKNVRDEIVNLPFQKLSTKYELYRRLNLAKDYIDTVCNTNISLKKISSEACLCTHHFIRLFKQVFGISPYQYLIKKRLQNSIHLLLRTELPINIISNSIGFLNASSFTRVFKSRYSLSPEKYRETNRRKKSILVKQ